MSVLEINTYQYFELEKLAWGAFAPLTGFMGREDFESSVETMRLCDGSVFPLPIVFDVSKEEAEQLKHHPTTQLSYKGEIVGEITPEDFFDCDREAVAGKLFGTASRGHPGVNVLFGKKEVFVGGKVRLLKRVRFAFSDHEMTPWETKALIAERGWKDTVGFQTRNVPHRAHEHLQRTALDQVDGLLIQPMVGHKKAGDFTPESILVGYQTLIETFYRPGKVALSLLAVNMRYAGPREAVLHALIRRNYGCTHFIVGRDHAGVGDHYPKYAAHELTRRFEGELGITIMRLHGPFLCHACDGFVTEHTCPHFEAAPQHVHEISGTEIRRILQSDAKPDPSIFREEVHASLSGVRLFEEENGE